MGTKTKALNAESAQVETKAQIGKIARVALPYAGLVIAVIFFSIATKGSFLQLDNLTTLINQSFTLILAALGATFIYAHGSLDVSLGSICMMSCISSVLAAVETQSGVVAFLVCLGVSLLCSLIVALISCKLGVVAFVSSLCVSFICQGLAGEMLDTGEIVMPTHIIEAVDRPAVKVIVIVAAIVICYVLFERTKIGVYNKAIGGNAAAAEQSGVNVHKYKILAYVISGVLLGVSSFFLICRISAASTTTGSGLHMDVMLAVILGGMSIRGGPKSNIAAPVIGSLTTYVLSNGLTLMRVDAYYVQFIQGIIFLLIIFCVFDKKKHGALPN